MSDRRARFVCRLSLYLPDADAFAGTRIFAAEGVLSGVIEPEARGGGGFGYDPVFRPQGWSRTLGEASAEEKDAVSHRAAAARALLRELRAAGMI